VQHLKQSVSWHLFRKFTRTRLTQIQLTSCSMSNREWTTRSFCQKQRAKRWQTPLAWTKTLNLTTRSTVCCSDAMLFNIKDTRGACQYASAMRTETAEPEDHHLWKLKISVSRQAQHRRWLCFQNRGTWQFRYTRERANEWITENCSDRDCCQANKLLLANPLISPLPNRQNCSFTCQPTRVNPKMT